MLGLVSIFVAAYFSLRVFLLSRHRAEIDSLNVILWAAGITGLITSYVL